MSNEEIVLEKLKKKAVTPLHFRDNDEDYDLEFKADIKELKELDDIVDRIRTILVLSTKYETVNKWSKHQCYEGARRSAQDIYRLYIYYFDDKTTIFDIMRGLYKLLESNGTLNVMYCNNVRKLVFYFNKYWRYADTHTNGDLGVCIGNWKDIGLNYEIKPIS